MKHPLRIYTNREVVARIKYDNLSRQGARGQFDCLRPVPLHLVGLPGLLDPDSRITAETVGRCRRCENCMRHRARLWTARAIDEVKSSQRSWFGTLTLHPDHAFRFRLLAERTINRRASKPYSELTETERTCAIAREANAELTRWLKRVRKNSGSLLRYLLVCEPHKSGVPHWHILLHEHEGRATKRVLEKAWRIGISHWRLVEGVKPAAYVCKYLTKTLQMRPRASGQYGTAGVVLYTERLLQSKGHDTSSDEETKRGTTAYRKKEKTKE